MSDEVMFLQTGHAQGRIALEIEVCYRHGDWCSHCYLCCPECFRDPDQDDHVTDELHELGGEGA